MEQNSNSSEEEKVKESITLRGICASIQAMAMPTMKNLTNLLLKMGYKISLNK